MTNCLKEFENHKDIKDIKDIIDEINQLNELYNSKRYDEMNEHIRKLMNKYFVETLTWNSVNKVMPQTIEQQYINANNFLKAQGMKVLHEKSKLSKISFNFKI